MNNSEPSLLSSAWRSRWLVLVVTALVVTVGLVVHLLRPPDVVLQAVATVVIQEPLASDEFGITQRASIQFVAGQVEIMNSPVVANQASEILAEDGLMVAADEILASVDILSRPESPLVTILAVDSDAQIAVAIANSVASGYRDVSQRQATATAASQVGRLDAQIEGINERLDEIAVERRDLESDDPAFSRIEEQAREAVALLGQLQEELIEATGEEAASIRLQIQDHRSRISVYEEVISSPVGPELQSLAEEEGTQVARRAQLLTLRDQIAVDAELAPDALALVQPAMTAERLAGIGTTRVLAVSVVLGMILGVTLAYFLNVTRRTLTSRHEPESILGAPLLSDIPDFDLESLESQLPVRDHPRSAAAEAYRFAASSLEAISRARQVRSVFAISSTLGQGKTTTVVNCAAALAIQGSSVLVLDCDFGNQAASRLLVGDPRMGLPGITDVVEGVSSAEEALQRIDLGNGIEILLMGRGTRPSLAATALQSGRARALFAELREKHDVVLIDGPPVLQVAYASTLAEMADGLLVVVEHQGSYSELSDLTARLAPFGTPILGYVYNRSPLRREMTMGEGSMVDILGDSGLVHPPARNPSSRKH